MPPEAILQREDEPACPPRPRSRRWKAAASPSRGRRDNERAFRRAMRHSRRVRMLRMAIPVVVVLILGATRAGPTWLDPLRILARLPVDAGRPGDLRHQDHHGGAQAQRLHARLALVRTDRALGRPGHHQAEHRRAATRSAPRSRPRTRARCNVTAADGTYDRKAGVLTLSRDIVLQSTERLRGAPERSGDRHRHRRDRFQQAGRGADRSKARSTPTGSKSSRPARSIRFDRRRDHESAGRAADAGPPVGGASHEPRRPMLMARAVARRAARGRDRWPARCRARRRSPAPARAFPTRCRASRRTATSRCRSRRPRSRCATRTRSRPSPAT